MGGLEDEVVMRVGGWEEEEEEEGVEEVVGDTGRLTGRRLCKLLLLFWSSPLSGLPVRVIIR